jgi:metallophosphoesterase (TIGR03767 family)
MEVSLFTGPQIGKDAHMRETRLLKRGLAAAALLTIAAAPAAFGHAGHLDPGATGAAKTTDQTIGNTGPDFGDVGTRAGESHRVIRRFERGQSTRVRTRVSLLRFAQLTDPQIADEMSPARVDFLDAVGGDLSSAWRPQEAFGPFVWDSAVRAVNDHRASEIRQGNGRRRNLDMAILTGDLLDNQQRNEARWYVDVLEGGRIDPFSGKPLTADNPCGNANEDQARALNDNVANRRYTGVQDFGDYPGVPADRYLAYWDPNVQQSSGSYSAFPTYPGLMDRAQMQFEAEGLNVPWYTSRGNHDGLVQGNAPANDLLRTIATGCLKVFPGNSIDPQTLIGRDFVEIFNQLRDPAFLSQLLASGVLVSPDPERRFVGREEFKTLHGSGDRNHGFGYVDRRELRASDGAAAYYGFTKRGVRMVSIDTVAEGGLSTGNVDDPQYNWLERELDRNSSVEVGRGGALTFDRDPNRLIVVYGHHTLGSMNNPLTDEEAPACTATRQPGCDEDPRRSRPVHRGVAGRENLRDLLLRYPNVVAYVSGHTHENAIDPYINRRSRTGFWQLNTASLVDPPQQLRTIELMDNRDGTLSIFNTVLDTAAPAAVPAPGTNAGSFSNDQLASISRAASFRDPQESFRQKRGSRNDRNVELLLRDPRTLSEGVE